MTGFWVGPDENPDSYLLMRNLGGGGEGDVWQAQSHVERGEPRDVAVKILPSRGRNEERNDWVDHGQLLRSFAHPGVVRVLAAFVGPTRHRAGEPRPGVSRYLVMDFVDGPDLRGWLEANPESTTAERLRLLRLTADALDEMHHGAGLASPIAHGDVKPSNIVVRPPGSPVLVDLGLMRQVDRPGATGRSAPYAAPEMRGPRPQATAEADRWAFVATVAEFLTGAGLPTTSTFLDLPELERRLRTAPSLQQRPGLPDRILGFLEAEPEVRPRSLRDWIEGSLDSLSEVTSGQQADLQSEAATRQPAATVRPEHEDELSRSTHLFAETSSGVEEHGGATLAATRTSLVLLVVVFVVVLAAAGLVLVLPASVGGGTGGPLTADPNTTKRSPTPSKAAPTMAIDPRAPRAAQYACSPRPPAVIPTPSAPGPGGHVYDVNAKASDGATPLQVDPGGYLDQAFVATTDTIASVAAVLALPEPDSLPTPTATIPATYELWNLTDPKPITTATKNVGQLESNKLVSATFHPPIPVTPGQVYFFRVVYPPPPVGEQPAQPSLAVYTRGASGSFVPLPVPLCDANRDPSRALPPLLDQGSYVSAIVSPP